MSTVEAVSQFHWTHSGYIRIRPMHHNSHTVKAALPATTTPPLHQTNALFIVPPAQATQ